jgi:uncharacterized protein YjbJ (UPF0337 family)
MNRFPTVSTRLREERRVNMKKDILKGIWKEMKGALKEKWGKLTDDDLTEMEGKEEKLLGILQKRYGYTEDRAKKEYNDFIDRYKE